MNRNDLQICSWFFFFCCLIIGGMTNDMLMKNNVQLKAWWDLLSAGSFFFALGMTLFCCFVPKKVTVKKMVGDTRGYLQERRTRVPVQPSGNGQVDTQLANRVIRSQAAMMDYALGQEEVITDLQGQAYSALLQSEQEKRRMAISFYERLLNEKHNAAEALLRQERGFRREVMQTGNKNAKAQVKQAEKYADKLQQQAEDYQGKLEQTIYGLSLVLGPRKLEAVQIAMEVAELGFRVRQDGTLQYIAVWPADNNFPDGRETMLSIQQADYWRLATKGELAPRRLTQPAYDRFVNYQVNNQPREEEPVVVNADYTVLN